MYSVEKENLFNFFFPILQMESAIQYQNLIIQHMDIAEPLTTLRKLLEQRLHCSLKDHEFYLQDAMLVRVSVMTINGFFYVPPAFGAPS